MDHITANMSLNTLHNSITTFMQCTLCNLMHVGKTLNVTLADNIMMEVMMLGFRIPRLDKDGNEGHSACFILCFVSAE